MKKLFFVRSGSTCRMLRILAAAMLLLPVNLQPVRASRQDAGAKSSLTVKMKDATLSSVFAEVERTSRYAFIYTDDVRPLLDRRVSVSVRSATIDELLSAVLKGTELTGRVRESQVFPFITWLCYVLFSNFNVGFYCLYVLQHIQIMLWFITQIQ